MKIKTLFNLLFVTTASHIYCQNISIKADLKMQPSEKINLSTAGIEVSVNKKIDSVYTFSNSTNYSSMHTDYSEMPAIHDDRRFKLVNNTFRFSAQLLKSTTFTAELQTVAAFEQHLDISDIFLLGGFEASRQFNDKNNLTLGVKRSNVFGKPQWLPFVSYWTKLNFNTEITIGFPKSEIKWSLHPNSIFKISNDFNGSFYHSDFNSGLIGFSQMTTALQYERIVDKNFSVYFKGGYDFNRSYFQTNSDFQKTTDFYIENGCNLSISIKYKL